MSGTTSNAGPRPPLLSAGRRAAVYATGTGLWLTGSAWLILHYYMMREGPFGPEPHPTEFWSLAAHGAFGFAALFMFGLMWGVHILAGWRSLRRRWTGGLMFGLFAWLIVSGYLLYYLGNDELIALSRVSHWVLGLVSPLPFLVHRFGLGSARTAP